MELVDIPDLKSVDREVVGVHVRLGPGVGAPAHADGHLVEASAAEASGLGWDTSTEPKNRADMIALAKKLNPVVGFYDPFGPVHKSMLQRFDGVTHTT